MFLIYSLSATVNDDKKNSLVDNKKNKYWWEWGQTLRPRSREISHVWFSGSLSAESVNVGRSFACLLAE